MYQPIEKWNKGRGTIRATDSNGPITDEQKPYYFTEEEREALAKEIETDLGYDPGSIQFTEETGINYDSNENRRTGDFNHPEWPEKIRVGQLFKMKSMPYPVEFESGVGAPGKWIKDLTPDSSHSYLPLNWEPKRIPVNTGVAPSSAPKPGQIQTMMGPANVQGQSGLGYTDADRARDVETAANVQECFKLLKKLA